MAVCGSTPETARALWGFDNRFVVDKELDTLLAKRFRTFRALSWGLVSLLVAALALVVVAPAQADEVYPRPASNTITLSGHAYGHGHGLSQWGAYGAAQVGRLSWQNILAFYYPGTTLTAFGNTPIRVRLDAVGPRTMVVVNAAGLLLDSAAGTAQPLPQLTSTGFPITRYRVITLTDGRLQVDALSPAGWALHQFSATPVAFSNPSGGALVGVLLANGTTQRMYRGRIVANWATATVLTPVSVLPMESYLRAVVPAEMPSSWHPNALAAQAVAARSYASQNRSSAPAGRTFDTCDTTSCQVYSGVPAEKLTTDAAILATAGQTLTYLGKPAFTQFAASNGGWSSAGSKPYLVAKADPYDGAIPNGANTWTSSITVASIQAHWPSIGTYQQLRIISRDGNGQWGGRILQAVIVGSAGSVTVTGATIRSAFGLRSEWFIPTNVRSAPSYPRDFNGDRKADVLAARSNGALWMFAGDGAGRWSSKTAIGSGFHGYSKVFTAGTWNGDAISDVMAQKTDGSLWLFPGTASGALGPARVVGSGWDVNDLTFPVGDFGGDGVTDLITRRPNGALMLYSGNGTGGFLGDARQIGSGWGIFTAVLSPGDFTGDGKADVVGRTSTGLLYLYPGNGAGGWLARRLIGQGWNILSPIISPGDLNSDGRSDLLGRAADGTLWMYPGNGTGGFLARKSLGAGWNVFSTVLP